MYTVYERTGFINKYVIIDNSSTNNTRWAISNFNDDYLTTLGTIKHQLRMRRHAQDLENYRIIRPEILHTETIEDVVLLMLLVVKSN